MLEALLTRIDIYCERTGPELWSEPVNALTNLAFVAAGLWGLRLARREEAGRFVEVLAWWVVAIGVGSALFHTFANRLTIWADILPIAIFTLAYTFFSLRRFLGFGRARAWAILVLFYLATGLVTAAVPEALRDASNGSTAYLPALLAFLFFPAWLALRGHPAAFYYLAAAGTFMVSVSFRAVDPLVCDAFPLGSHFMWHLLNALMLGLLLTAAARYARSGNVTGRETAGKVLERQF